jgi:hypothetical protein
MIIRLKAGAEEDLEVLVSLIWLKLEREELQSPSSLTVIEDTVLGLVVELAFECPLAGAKILTAFCDRHCNKFGIEQRRAGAEADSEPPDRGPAGAVDNEVLSAQLA